MARAASSNQLSGSNCPNMINSCLPLNFPPTLSRQDLEVRFSFVRYVSPHLPGWRFGPGFVCRNQEQQRRLGKPSVVVRWQMDFSTSRVLLSVYSGPGQRCKSNVIIQRQEGEGGTLTDKSRHRHTERAAVASFISRKPWWFSRSKGYRTHNAP